LNAIPQQFLCNEISLLEPIGLSVPMHPVPPSIGNAVDRTITILDAARHQGFTDREPPHDLDQSLSENKGWFRASGSLFLGGDWLDLGDQRVVLGSAKLLAGRQLTDDATAPGGSRYKGTHWRDPLPAD
jgi:hypothetical protein